MSRQLSVLLAIVMLLSSLLFGCAAPAVQAPAPTAVPATQAPAPIAVSPTRAPEPTAVPPTQAPAIQELILATTTSTQDSGLLDVLLPDFEKEFGVKVNVIAVGTGQAIKLGEDGNADVLLVHARAKEDAFMAAGHGVRREDVMYNDFVIVGPKSDPAGIKGMTAAAAASQKIADARAPFISRGDDSGTHTKEKSIWKAAGIEPAGDWYISAGQGMGAVLTMANEQLAYTLSDRATYLARTLEGIDLVILTEGDPLLFNPYGVIAVNPAKGPQIKADLANTFIDWLISLPTQEKVGQFGVAEFGAPLFTPDSVLWRAAHPAQAGGPAAEPAAGIPENAALKITGQVKQEIGWTEEAVRAMGMIEAQSTNKQGETSTYTGVPINKLLELAGIGEGATAMVLVADDGFTAELPLADVQACADCIASFRSKGGFSAVMPGFPSSAQVKGLIEIQVK